MSVWSDIIDKDIYATDEQSALDWLDEVGDSRYRESVEVEDLREKYDALVEKVQEIAEELAYNGIPAGLELLDALKGADSNE